MEKEFVPYELAVKLKALGFDEPCFGRWWFRADMHRVNEEKLEIIKSYYFELPEYYILAPTFSQAFRWFREKYNLHSYIEGSYPWFRFYINSEDNMWEGHKHLKFEEAELACLEKLIEIVESKSE